MTAIACIFLGIAAVPFIYYLIAFYSSWNYFRRNGRIFKNTRFTPPVSNLKPIRGLDPEAYENFASLCRQDYPEYELLFCVSASRDPAVPVIEKLARDFPERRIRVIIEPGQGGSNDKVAKLARLVNEAQNEVLVINDSDVRVAPDYLRTVVAPLQSPAVGAVTCFYASAEEKSFAGRLHSAGMMSDFYAGILVAKQLDGIKFTIGKTIATTRSHLAEFGGYEVLINRPGDDLLVGRLISERGHTVELLPHTVLASSPYTSFRELLHRRLRWIIVMRHMRPWGHFGLIFTFGLPWCIAAICARPSLAVALIYLGVYGLLRIAVTWMIGIHGLHRPGLWRQMWLIPVWDAVAFCLWIASFTRSSVRWRDGEYYIRNGQLVPVISVPAEE